MMNNEMKVHYSSNNHTWETPQDFFDELNSMYGFTLDACAEDKTAKVLNYFTIEDDALTQDWKGIVWCNPPYGREQIKFIQKALEEHKKHGSTIVLLIPARPDTKVWQDTIFPDASNICFVRGRLKFGHAKHGAPFPCALVVFGEYKDMSNIGWCV